MIRTLIILVTALLFSNAVFAMDIKENIHEAFYNPTHKFVKVGSPTGTKLFVDINSIKHFDSTTNDAKYRITYYTVATKTEFSNPYMLDHIRKLANFREAEFLKSVYVIHLPSESYIIPMRVLIDRQEVYCKTLQNQTTWSTVKNEETSLVFKYLQKHFKKHPELLVNNDKKL